MENLEKICNTTHYNFPKNTILIPISKALNIDYKTFKNRRELITAIREHCPPSKRCENSQDFVSLCDIDDIPKERLFIWNQCGKTYGADIVSIKLYIDSGKSINPWTIDLATGVEKAKNTDEYLQKYDMKKQRGLIQKINNFYSNFRLKESSISDIDFNDQEDVDSINHIRFEIENFGDEADQYVTHIINAIEKCEIRIFVHILADTLKLCLDYFMINNDLQVYALLESIFFNNELLKFHTFMQNIENTLDNLTLLTDILRNIKNTETIYSVGVIKYFFIELEENLKNYNLLSR